MISIIMAVYNGEKYLAEQIDSILQGSYQDFMIHIFDDGSTDGSREVISQYAQKHPQRITPHFNEKNQGVIKNFLGGLQAQEADYYMFCDQDDVWLPEKLQHTLEHMQRREKLDSKKPIAVFGDAKMVDGELNELHPSFQRQSGYRTDHLDLGHMLMENKLIGCTVMINHKLKALLADYPEQMRMHDWWIALVAAAFGEISYLDEPLLLYRQHGNNVVGGASQSDYRKDRISKLGKQREVLYQTCAQAAAFLDVYSDRLGTEQKKIIQAFATLPEVNWFARRCRLFRYGFWKSGIVRNVGVLLVI